MADIVIYGGTFNPIHNGHMAVCRYVSGELGAPKILLIPTAAPPHKEAPALAPGEDRLAMCRLAAAELSGAEVLDWELLRGGLSYTIETLRYLSECYSGDRLFLLMGSDMFLTFREWRD
ncbi:MAG: nicotinate-nicotinamide nucleotide adenylyltransferase, partial [Angelakisella sp.]